MAVQWCFTKPLLRLRHLLLTECSKAYTGWTFQVVLGAIPSTVASISLASSLNEALGYQGSWHSAKARLVTR